MNDACRRCGAQADEDRAKGCRNQGKDVKDADLSLCNQCQAETEKLEEDNLRAKGYPTLRATLGDLILQRKRAG